VLELVDIELLFDAMQASSVAGIKHHWIAVMPVMWKRSEICLP